MTEKRFTMYQNTIYDEGQIINPFECMKLLNYFYDENTDLVKMNKQLREENKELKKENAQFDILIKNNQLAYIDLEKENEQLKKDVEYWKQVASQYSNELNVFEHCKKYKTECKDIHWSSD